MKKFEIIFIVLALMVFPCLFKRGAEAVSFSFAGASNITDTNSNGFSELVSFDTQTIFASDPDPDNILFNNVEISDLTLAGTWSVIGGSTVFDFSPTYYTGGFRVQDFSSTDLLTADLQALNLTTNVGEGTINSELLINLSNIIVTPAGIALGSDVLNAFSSSSVGGILTLTLQYNGDLANAIQSGSLVTTTNSGTASTASRIPDPQVRPVPEPATILILGLGLFALAGIQRVKKIKKLF